MRDQIAQIRSELIPEERFELKRFVIAKHLRNLWAIQQGSEPYLIFGTILSCACHDRHLIKMPADHVLDLRRQEVDA